MHSNSFLEYVLFLFDYGTFIEAKVTVSLQSITSPVPHEDNNILGKTYAHMN